MIRPLAYITADFSSRDDEADEAAKNYCRALYEAVIRRFARFWRNHISYVPTFLRSIWMQRTWPMSS